MRTRRTWKKFWNSYSENGGWMGSDTIRWVSEGADILMSHYGVTAHTAGRIMAEKQAQSGKFKQFAETGGATANVRYMVLGKGTQTELDRKVLRMIENGAHAGQVAEMVNKERK